MTLSSLCPVLPVALSCKMVVQYYNQNNYIDTIHCYSDFPIFTCSVVLVCRVLVPGCTMVTKIWDFFKSYSQPSVSEEVLPLLIQPIADRVIHTAFIENNQSISGPCSSNPCCSRVNSISVCVCVLSNFITCTG